MDTDKQKIKKDRSLPKTPTSLAKRIINRFRNINNEINRKYYEMGDETYITAYSKLINELVNSEKTIVHIACGSKNIAHWAPGQDIKAKVYAVDLDKDALQRNTTPEEFKIHASVDDIPLPDNFADIILSEHGFEHFEDPYAVLCECSRLMNRKGQLIAIIPNGLTYMAIAARIIPYELGTRIHRLLGGVDSDAVLDKYPVYYRFNDPPTIRKLTKRSGFKIRLFRGFVGPPGYTTILPPPVHLLFCAYHAMIETSEVLKTWQGMSYLIVLEKL